MARTKSGRTSRKTRRQKKIKKVLQRRWRNDLKINHGHVQLDSEGLYTKEARYRNIIDNTQPGDDERIKASKKLTAIEGLIKDLIVRNNGNPLYEDVEVDEEVDESDNDEEDEEDEDSDSAVSLSSVEAGIRIRPSQKGTKQARSPSVSLSPIGATVIPSARGTAATIIPIATQTRATAASGPNPIPPSSSATVVPKQSKKLKEPKAPKPNRATNAPEATLPQALPQVVKPEVVKKKRGRKPKALETDEVDPEWAAPPIAPENIYSGRLRSRAPTTNESMVIEATGDAELGTLSTS